MIYWISFASAIRGTDIVRLISPDNERFLGVVIVDAETAAEATNAVFEWHGNPGGQMMIVPVPISESHQGPEADWIRTCPRMTLFQRKDLPDFLLPVRIADMEDRETLEEYAGVVCEECNAPVEEPK